jgi:hypothetical protein
MSEAGNNLSANVSWRNRGRSVSISLASGIVALIVAIVLSNRVLTSARAFAPDGQVSSIDELYKLGSGPTNAAIGIWLPLVLSAIVSVIVLVGRGHRWAWIFPLAASAVGIVLSFYFIDTFQAPAPEFGG